MRLISQPGRHAAAPYSVPARVWRPTLVRAGLLGTVAELDSTTDAGDRYRATWTSNTGETATATFRTYAQAVKHVARHAGDALRFHDLRHSYATWLVDDEVPPNMIQRVMGHEQVSTTLQLYVRRTEHHDRIREALGGTIAAPEIRMTTTAPLVCWCPSDESDVPGKFLPAL